jgi:hypothetical protein
MNERILELEKQCWSHRVDGTLVDGQLHFDTKKFAELIIKECLLAIDNTNKHHAYTTFDIGLIESTIIKSKESVKQHFGV